MDNDKGIFIKNIYYMLSYAFNVLTQKNYESVAAEDFENIQDLFAAILAKGVAQQLKQGLHREYITWKESLPTYRGKLDIQETIKNQNNQKRLLACECDELSVDNIYNQILKTTIGILLRDTNVKPERKADLKRIVLYFGDVTIIDPTAIRWNMLRYQRNNKNYEMLMNVCYFVLEGMLQTTENGQFKVATFSDDLMHRLYEKFILEYYKKHHTYLDEVKAAQIKWDLDPSTDEKMIRFLPIMQSDIFLRYKEQVLIIDAKYYGKSMQRQYDKATLHSNNVYQVFTYVKNQDSANTGKVSGLLLYAKTEEDITPDCSFIMGGNRIGAKTLDLNKEFLLIRTQLDRIAEEWINIQK